MMRTLKKLKRWCTLLCVLMVCTCSMMAHASGNVTINTSGDVATSATFVGYKLLELNTKFQCNDANHVQNNEADPNHSEACYTYTFSYNAYYKNILLEVVGSSADTNNDGDTTIEEMCAYLEKMDEDTTRAFADAVYKKIKAAGISPDATTSSGVASSVERGYWLFADTTAVDNQEGATKSLTLLNVKGAFDLTIKEKKSIPTAKKEVTDKENGVLSSAVDVNIGDTVYFTLTGTLPQDEDDSFESYTQYQYIFHDTLSAGLTVETSNVKVYVVNGGNKTEVKTGAGVALNGQNLTITMDDVKELQDAGGNKITVDKNSQILVEYTATLNENAVVGGTGNPNEVYLEYSNDPYSDTSTGKTVSSKVNVYTFALQVDKIDSKDNTKLNDAEFRLYRELTTGNKEYATVVVETAEDPNVEDDWTIYRVTGWTMDSTSEDIKLVTSGVGTFTVEGLEQGTYYLEETKAPGNYNLLNAPIKLVIAATYDTEDVETLNIKIDDKDPAVDGTAATGTVGVTVENSKGPQLPSTGGSGTQLFYLIGTILIVIAGGVLIVKLRMRNKDNK